MSDVQDALDPVWVKYRVHEYASADFVRRLSGSDRAEYDDLRYTVDAEFSYKGDLIRTAHSGPLVTDGRLRPTEGPFVHVFDGQRTVRFDHRRSQAGKAIYNVSRRSAEAEIGYGRPWDLTHQRAVISTIEGLCTSDPAYERSIEHVGISFDDSYPEGPLIVIEVVGQSGGMIKMWLLRELGYSVARFETYETADELLLRVDDTSYRRVAGVPFPDTATVTSYAADTGELMQVRRLEVLDIVTDPQLIPDSLFRLDIPEGAEVVDKDLGLRLRDPEEIQQHLDRMVGKRGSRFWLVVGNVVVLLGLLVFAAVRYLRAARRG